MIKELTSRTFSEEVFESDKICVVQFGASWCAPCRALRKAMEELDSIPSDDVEYCFIDAEANHTISRKCAIEQLPQVLIFDGNIIKRRVIGYVPKEELEMLISNIVKFAKQKGIENL